VATTRSDGSDNKGSVSDGNKNSGNKGNGGSGSDVLHSANKLQMQNEQ